MNGLLFGSGFSLSLALLGGVALVLLLRSATQLIYWLPMSRAGLSRAQRWLPVMASSLCLVYLVVAGEWLLRGAPHQGWILPSMLLLMAAASWRAVRDATDGLFLRATGACRRGDYVQLDELDGRVRELGWRFMTLETREGHVATVPYGRVVQAALRRLPEVKHGVLHVFRLELHTPVGLPVVKRTVLRAALLCPWCVPKRSARTRSLQQGKELEVTLSLVDADHASEAEEVIRDAVRALGTSALAPRSERRPSHPPVPGPGDAPPSEPATARRQHPSWTPPRNAANDSVRPSKR